MQIIAVSTPQPVTDDWVTIFSDERNITTMEFECDTGSYEVAINLLPSFRVKSGQQPKLRRVSNNGISSVAIRALEPGTTGLWSYAVVN